MRIGTEQMYRPAGRIDCGIGSIRCHKDVHATLPVPDFWTFTLARHPLSRLIQDTSRAPTVKARCVEK